MKTFTKITLAVILLSPLPWKWVGDEVLAQNTFRYKICEDTSYSPKTWTVGTFFPDGSVPTIHSGGYAHQVPSDSGYVLFTTATRSYPSFPTPPLDSLFNSFFSATKLDKYGNLEWIRVYRELSDPSYGKILSDGIPTSDSGFIMAGNKARSGCNYYCGNYTIVQKTDKDGHPLWAKVYDIYSSYNAALKVLQMPDGGFIVMGTTTDGYAGIYLLRLDKNGNKNWCYTYDDNISESGVLPASLAITTDGGFVISGTANVSYDSPNIDLRGPKGFIMKVSSNGQTVQWARRYGQTAFAGRFGTDYGNDVFLETKQTGDGGYISVGNTGTAYDGSDTRYSWVVKTDAMGLIKWHKMYNRSGLCNWVEVLNDGYMLGGVQGNMTKISETGDVMWSKIYDKSISGINLAMDSGFVTNYGGSTITKTDRWGEFDAGCVFNDAFSTTMEDDRVDTLYALTPQSVNVTPSDLALKEVTITGRHACPVMCGISRKPVAPYYIYAYTACANTNAGIYLTAAGTGYSIFSHFKVDFGDPASGKENNTKGSYNGDAGPMVYHNYSNTGTYTLTAIFYNGDYSDSATVYANVYVVPSLKLTLTTPPIVCKTDTITLTARADNYLPGVFSAWAGGWQAGSSNNQLVISQTWSIIGSTATIMATVIADNTSPNYYYIGFSNAYGSGCPVSDTLYVKTGDNEALITGNTEICTGGTALLKASGGDSYLWSTGAKTEAIKVSPASNTTYWVEATTTDGCRDTGYVYVKVVSGINVKVVSDRQTTVCIGDTVTLYAAGAQHYTWGNGATTDTIKVIPAIIGQNTYLVTGTDGYCTDTTSIQILADPIPNGMISGPAQVCGGTPFTAIASGGDSYYWTYSPDRNNPVQTFGIPGGANTTGNSVRITRGACSITVPYSPPSTPIMTADPFFLDIEAYDCRVCPGTTVTVNPIGLTASQNLTYQWSTGQTGIAGSLTVTKDTIVTLVVTNSNGCSFTDSTIIEVKPHFLIEKEVSGIATCADSPTTLYLTGGALFDFTWGNGSKEDTLVYQPPTDGWLTITAIGDDCIRKDSVWVYAKPNLPKATITGNSIVCKGTPNTYTVTGNAPITGYQWLSDNSSNPTITVSPTGDITLKAVLTFTLGCSDTAEFKIKVKDAAVTKVSGNTQLCPDGTTELIVSGGYTYRWSTGSSSNKIKVTAPKDTTLNVIISNNGCANDTLWVTVTTDKTINATLFSDEDTICSGTALTLIAGGGDAYTWNTGEKGKQIGILPGTNTGYIVNVSSGDDNCNDTAGIFITVKPSPTLSVSGQTTLCSGKSTTLQATTANGTGYLWNTGASTASISVNPTKDSTYSVSTFIGDCSVSQSLSISVTASTSISAGAGQTVLSGTEVTLEATGGNNYNWSTTEDGLLCDNCNSLVVNPVKTTTYYVTETNATCSEDSVTVYVLNCSELGIPNAFSPNGDQVNDVLFLQNDCIKNLDFKIYDRWGEEIVNYKLQIANGESSIQVWDGMYKGQMMDPAVFVYYVSATVLSGEVITQQGNVTLIR